MNNIYLAKIKNIIKPNGENFPVRLSDNEKLFFIECLKSVSNYLEFGSGGSTILALKSENTKKIVSVESDLNWIKYLRKSPTINDAKEGRLNLIHIDIGKTGKWGVPTQIDKKELFPDYSTKIFTQYENDYDLVFVDGRFRVACVLQTILNCKPDVKILIHDYNDRPQYHSILQFVNIIYTIDTMALFSIKENIDRKKVEEVYEFFKYDYR